jgi:hypothetical protein
MRVLVALVNSPAAVFLFALFVRFWVIAQLLPEHAKSGFYFPNEPSRVAWAIISGFGYSSPWPHTLMSPTAVLPPIYPYLLAGIFKIAGIYSYSSLWIAVGLNAVFSAVSAVLILKLGKQEFGAPCGVLAAWTWAAWLYEAVVSIRLWESSLSTLLLLSSVFLLTKLSQSLKMSQWILFGFLAGIAALTNTTLLSLFPFFWLWLWLSYRRRGLFYGKWVLVSIATCLITLLPWTVRNYIALHKLIPVRDNLGLELWVGNHQGVTHLYDFPASFPLHDPTEFNRVGELRFMELRRDEAVQFIRQHPEQFLHLTAERCFYYWTTPELYVWLPISVMAWLGAALTLRHKGMEAVPYIIILIVFPGIYYVTHPWPTYRHPVEPIMLLMSAYAAVNFADFLLKYWARSKQLFAK